MMERLGAEIREKADGVQEGMRDKLVAIVDACDHRGLLGHREERTQFLVAEKSHGFEPVAKQEDQNVNIFFDSGLSL